MAPALEVWSLNHWIVREVSQEYFYNKYFIIYLCYCCLVPSVVSDSVRPHSWQPIRLLRPWDSSGKKTGVGCHFLLHCMKGKSESEVAQSCPTPRDPMDCSLTGSSVCGICQARVLEWVAIAFSEVTRCSCQTRLLHLVPRIQPRLAHF